MASHTEQVLGQHQQMLDRAHDRLRAGVDVVEEAARRSLDLMRKLMTAPSGVAKEDVDRLDDEMHAALRELHDAAHDPILGVMPPNIAAEARKAVAPDAMLREPHVPTPTAVPHRPDSDARPPGHGDVGAAPHRETPKPADKPAEKPAVANAAVSDKVKK